MAWLNSSSVGGCLVAEDEARVGGVLDQADQVEQHSTSRAVPSLFSLLAGFLVAQITVYGIAHLAAMN